MTRYNIILILIALLLMNFQCEQRYHTPLTIVNFSLTGNCTEDQTNYSSTLYISGQSEFVPAEEKTNSMGTQTSFQYTSIYSAYIKLEPLPQSACRSAWHKIEAGKRQSITLSYNSDQPIHINLTSQPSGSIDSLSLEVYRMLENRLLSGDDDEIKMTGLNTGSFPLTDFILSTSSSYRILLYEHNGQTRNILSNIMIETGEGGEVIEVVL